MSVTLKLSTIALLVLAVFAAMWFGTLASHRLLEPDEGRYAEIPREMVGSGDWVTPRLNGVKYFEKPALQYWATAAAYEIFGPSEWTARLWTALTGFLGLLLTVWIGWRLFGLTTALRAAAVQAGSLLYTVLGHLTTLDMGLTFALQLTMAGLLWLVYERENPERCKPAVAMLAIGVALAFLSKGLVGVLIPMAVAGLYVLIARDWKLLWRSQPWWSAAVLLVLAGPWIITVSQRNPEFAHFFFIHEHFDRFLTRAHHRHQPDWFFIAILLIGFFPWTPLLPAMAKDAWRSWRAKDRTLQLLTIWIVFIFLFFSFSQSKLAPYILPIFPALALLAGRALTDLQQRQVVRIFAVPAAIWLMLAVAAAVAVLWPGASAWVQKSAGDAAPGVVVALWAVATGAGAATVMAQRGRHLSASGLAALATLVFVVIALPAVTHLPKRQNVTAVLGHVKPHLNADTKLYCVGGYSQSIPFYLEKTCTLVGYRGEMEFGLLQEPWLFVDGLSAFAARWRAESDAVALVRPGAYGQLVQMNLPMRLIFSERNLIAIARR